MQWTSFDNGTTIGETGSESGVIMRDDEHSAGARITLERNGSIAPFSITCGIYGYMVHTRFFSTASEALQQFDLMASAFGSILQSSTTESALINSVGRFVEQFP